MASLQLWVQLAALCALHIVQLISAAIFVGGIADQAEYGPRICLLFVSNYRNEGTEFIFEAESGACHFAVGVGSVGIVLALIALVSTLYYYLNATRTVRTKTVALVSAIVSSLYAILLLITVSIVSVGLTNTCRQFENVQGHSCSEVFATGFFYEGIVERLYRKNLSVVWIAVSAGWISVGTWALYSIVEWWTWKFRMNKWW
ncbi:hypothetical protein SpCBS45565_g04491 [Spizellomyces sp. 'palustris']|nr:hypothetical protein SpCBS45565_g04491 [Spizellomyces sp. 'palustris']